MRIFKKLLPASLILICLFYKPVFINAQCTTPIAVFPYTENFEASNGGWFAGGTASDWVWGTPMKPVISGAAAGTKCWVTGGLTGSVYNNGENSWLQSPCFDFTALSFPEISFSVFWETEKKFDGASIQYSVDGALTWNNLGSINDDACTASNWFNNSSVNFLGTNGWSGNIQSTTGSCQGGSGSGGWLPARHDLTFLAGNPSVIFRFRFGAGTTCNNFDGFAVDEIRIAESGPASADFSFNCGPGTTMSFFKTTTGCPSGYLWDFGDPASGVNNSSMSANAMHTFSSTGVYTVSLTVSFSSGPPITLTHNVNVINVSTNITANLKCSGDMNAAIAATVNGGPGIYSFIWNTTPPQMTAAISNLPAGTYTVAVSGNNACLTTSSITITDPPAILAPVITADAMCNNNNGTAVATASGGNSPYTYLWSTGANTSSIINLAAGNYTLLVKDANGCSLNNNNIVISNINKQVPVFLGNDTVICPGQTLVLSPGVYSSYQWQDNSTLPTFTVTGSGTYSVKVTDANGCNGSDAINVIADCSDIYFPSAFTPDRSGLNDYFGAFGNTGLVKNFSLQVYDRWGELIFSSKDIFTRWDGKIKTASFNSGSFVWIASYSFNGGAVKTRHGVVTIIK
ncbi:MAG: gliding motility-associated C-terminal domain-containing protein [Ferruginibacter sp.]